MNFKESYINELYELMEKNYIKYLTTPHDYKRNLITKIIFQNHLNYYPNIKKCYFIQNHKNFKKDFII